MSPLTSAALASKEQTYGCQATRPISIGAKLATLGALTPVLVHQAHVALAALGMA